MYRSHFSGIGKMLHQLRIAHNTIGVIRLKGKGKVTPILLRELGPELISVSMQSVDR